MQLVLIENCGEKNGVKLWILLTFFKTSFRAIKINLMENFELFFSFNGKFRRKSVNLIAWKFYSFSKCSFKWNLVQYSCHTQIEAMINHETPKRFKVSKSINLNVNINFQLDTNNLYLIIEICSENKIDALLQVPLHNYVDL